MFGYHFKKAARKSSLQPKWIDITRAKLQGELLEDRLNPGLVALGATGTLGASLAFDPALGVLSLFDNPPGDTAQVATTGDGSVNVTLQGKMYSSDPAAKSFDPSLAGANAQSVHSINLFGGATLALDQLASAGNLAVSASGDITLAGTVKVAGSLSVSAIGLTVDSNVQAAALALESTGLVNIEEGGSLTAQAGANGASITVAANYFVNVGQVLADGAEGGTIAITAPLYLNAGTVSAAGANGPGGTVQIGFTSSYIDTAAALTTANGAGGVGGQVSVVGDGRLFSSGRFEASGTTGGGVNLLGQDIELVAATVDASGAAGGGGSVEVGVGYQGQDPTPANAQTVNVTAATSLRANGTTAGGHLTVWSEASTTFAGTVAATGSMAGGFIEVSSHGTLTYGGQADAGKDGTLLLDPNYLVISASTGVLPQFNLVNPETDGTFGTEVLTLSTGNIVVTDPTAITNVGAVYLFNGQTGALLSMLTGNTGGSSGDNVGGSGVAALTNGNYVVESGEWNGGKGAATWGSGTAGVSGVVSAANSLVGSTGGSPGDGVGRVTALTNGNYVVSSIFWNNSEGAATWGNGTTGISGTISAANSLVGSTGGANGDEVGFSVTALSNGNYVVASPNWNGNLGAVTWANGTTGISGTISAANSLVGSTGGTLGDQVGDEGVIALTNGNYVVDSVTWTGGSGSRLGAITWGNGTVGITGVVSAANSLVGSNPGDRLGNANGVYALPNGNYVVTSGNWNGNEGAVTWGSGTSGVSGVVSAANSLVGSTAGDSVGSGGVVALTNGNYVVDSVDWNGGEGAATWVSGTAGIVGVVSAANSLVGAIANDHVGGGVTALTNGNYVVDSDDWNGGEGAATWGNGTVGVSGVVSVANSLVGSTPGTDSVGSGGVTALRNGNYIVDSFQWSGLEGAVTWGSGTAGVVGVVSTANSLVGTNPGDKVGLGGVVALTNGNYVVDSFYWNEHEGAVTYGSGTTGVSGVVSASNSLVGTTPYNSQQVGGDEVGNAGVAALTNGNYVVDSSAWNGDEGAVTWGNGTVGVSAAVSAANSLVGSNLNDSVGSSVTALTNGNYVVYSSQWNSDEGAATWGSGSTGTTLDSQHTIDALNSLEGTSANAGLREFTPPGVVPGSFIAAFTTENGGVVIVGLPDPNTLTFGVAQGSALTVTPSFLTQTLNAGTNVDLQANDDITINSPITETPTGTAGSLTLEAGRSIFLNASINTASGNLTLIANQTQANGVINSQRDVGNAAITMVSGVTLNTGAGTLSVDLKTSTDKTNNGKGIVTLLGLTTASATLSAASVLGIAINGTTAGDGVAAGTYTQVNVTGTINLDGASLQISQSTTIPAGNSLIIVQSTGGVSGTFNGLPEGSVVTSHDGEQYTISYQGNGGREVVLTTTTPTTTAVTSPTSSAVYGQSVTFTATVTSSSTPTGSVEFFDETTGTDLGAGTLQSTTGTTATWTYTTTASQLQVTTSPAAQVIEAVYTPSAGFAGSSGTLSGGETITPLGLTVSGLTANNKVYDKTTAATLNTGSATLNGVLSGDTVTLSTSGAVGVFASKDVANGITVTVSGLSLSGAKAGDYTLTQPTTTADITPAALTVTGITANNKVYDHTTAATLNTGSATLNGVLSGDTVTLSTSSTVGVFAGKDVGNGITVTVSGLTLSGAQAGDYSVTQPTTTANITPATLTITGLAANNKFYDQTTTATLNTASAALSGVFSGDSVSLKTASAVGVFASKDVANSITVNVSGLTISGSQSGDYTLTQPTTTANITPATLTVTGITANNKVYDHTTTAALNTASAALSGVYSGDSVSLITSGATGIFVSQDVASGITVTVSGLTLGGPQAADYTLAQPATSANITPASGAAALTVTGITANNKVYDHTATASLNTGNAALVGVFSGDRVSLITSGAVGTFASQDVGNGITVSVSGLTLVGPQAGDYTLTQPTTSANITPATLTVSGITANNKGFDGTTSASLNTSGANLVGVYHGDSVTLGASGATGTFAAASVGTGITVTVTGLTIGGPQAGDYTLTQPTTSANISAIASGAVPEPVLVSGSPNGTAQEYTLNTSTGQYNASLPLNPFPGLGTDVRTAIGDVNGDGIPDYIFATGPGTPFEVTVISGAAGNPVLVAPFDPFLPAPPLAQSDVFTAGGFVSAGDFLGNGRVQIVVSPDQSGGPRVAIYDMNGAAAAAAQPYTPVGVNTQEVNPGSGLTRINNFLSVNPDFRGGARTAVGDLNGDGVPDLAIAAGFGGGPAVLVINGTKVPTTDGFTASDDLIGDFFAFNSTLRDGAYLAIGDVLGNGQQDLILGPGAGGPAEVEVISGAQLLNDGAVSAIANPVALFTPSGLGPDGSGMRVAVAASGVGDQVNVVVGAGRNMPGVVKVYPGTGFTSGSTNEPTGGQLLNPYNGDILADGIFVG